MKGLRESLIEAAIDVEGCVSPSRGSSIVCAVDYRRYITEFASQPHVRDMEYRFIIPSPASRSVWEPGERGV